MTVEHKAFAFVDPPPSSAPLFGAEASGYLIVRLSDEGAIEIQGSREHVNSFLQACALHGLILSLDYLSWCG